MRKALIGLAILGGLIYSNSAFGQIQLWGRDDQRKTQQEELIQKFPPINIIDTPTANFMNRKYFELQLRVYHLGGMLGGLAVGLTQRLMFGVSYGGQNIIGQGPVKWNQAPGVNIRYRLKVEDYRFPGICIGFDSQGYGTYYPEAERYQIKSKGAYVVVSKNYSILENFGIHGGMNYSGENKSTEKDLNFFCSAHLMLDPEITLLWEYDFAINDNDEKSLGSGKGYMNAGVRWHFSPRLIFEFSVKNLLGNMKTIEGEPVPTTNRELKIIYYESL